MSSTMRRASATKPPMSRPATSTKTQAVGNAPSVLMAMGPRVVRISAIWPRGIWAIPGPVDMPGIPDVAPPLPPGAIVDDPPTMGPDPTPSAPAVAAGRRVGLPPSRLAW